MMTYRRLTHEDRCQLYALRKAGKLFGHDQCIRQDEDADRKIPSADVVKSIDAYDSLAANVWEGNPKTMNAEARLTWTKR